MTPAREVPSLDPGLGLAVATLRWIDRIETAYGPTIARVARKLTLYCASLGIDRIEISDRQLVSFFGMHRNDIMQAAHALEGEFRIRTTIAGRVWHVPPGLIDVPGQETLPFPPEEPGGDFLFPVEKRPTPGRYPEPQFSLLSKKVAWESRPPLTRNQEVTDGWPGNPGQQVVHETRPPGSDWLKPPEQRPYFQQIQTCGLGNQASGLRNQARRVEVDSKKLEGPHALRSAEQPPSVSDLPEFDDPSLGRGVIDRIVQARAVENPDEAATIAACLFGHMRKFGPTDRNTRSYEDLLKDDVLLARIAAIAPLGGEDVAYGTLLYAFRQLDLEYKPCGREYGWFVTTLANRIHGTDRHELKAALNKARPRRKPQNQSTGGAEAAQNQKTENQELLAMAAGRTRW